MKVLHVLNHSLPLQSGYTFRSRNIFGCLADQGIEPVVVTSPKHEESWDGPWASEEEIDGVRYYRSGRARGPSAPFLAERALMKRLERRLLEVARVERPALIHAHSPVLNVLPALRVGRRLGIPVVYEIRAFWEDAGADQGTYREWGLKYRMVRAAETLACRRCDHVFTICQGLKQDLVARGLADDRITVVPNAVNPEEFSPVAPDPALARRWGLEGRFTVGFLGSFFHFEGLDVLLESLARLNGALPDLAALLVGGGEMEERLRQQARALGLQSRIVFTGRRPHHEMPGLYALVDLLVFPRKPIRLTELVTPLKPLEAMAMGKPVLASDVGGHRELIRHGETGWLFPAGDASALAEALVTLGNDPQLRSRLAAAGRDWVVRERTWRRNGSVYARVYARLLSGEPSP